MFRRGEKMCVRHFPFLAYLSFINFIILELHVWYLHQALGVVYPSLSSLIHSVFDSKHHITGWAGSRWAGARSYRAGLEVTELGG